jgi:hypothetical protein
MSNFVGTSYGGAAAITPSDTVNLGGKAIYVGGAGNVTCVTEGGNVTLFTAPPVGSVIPIRFTRVNATGTTATALVALS